MNSGAERFNGFSLEFLDHLCDLKAINNTLWW